MGVRASIAGATGHTCGSIRGARRISRRAALVVEWVVPVCNPIIDVSRHVEDAIVALSFGELGHVAGLLQAIVEVQEIARRLACSPRIGIGVGSGSCLFPLSFGWQTGIDPIAVRNCLVVGDAYDGIVEAVESTKIGIVTRIRRGATILSDADGVLVVGDIRGVDPVVT